MQWLLDFGLGTGVLHSSGSLIGGVASHTGRRGWLDFAIVSSLLLLPQSSFLWMNSSEFGASPLRRVPFFILPALLLLLRLTRPSRRLRSGIDPVVLALWIAVLIQGLIMALLHTEHLANTLSVYGQSLYWLALAAIFLSSLLPDGPFVVFDMIRRYFVLVSLIAWLFVVLFFVFGERLPHTTALIPDPEGNQTAFADNYYLTLAYSAHSVFGRMIPRFAFFYREPRVLGILLVMGIVLQIGHTKSGWDSWRPIQRRKAIIELGLLGGALFWAHSFNGYLFASAMAIGLGTIEITRSVFWRRFRAIWMVVLAAGIVITAAAVIIIGRREDLVFLVEDVLAQTYVEAPVAGGSSLAQFVGKEPRFIASYIITFLTAPRAIIRFPMGVGIMNLDSERFTRDFGVPTNGGATLLQFFSLNAGFAGLAAFFIIVWRLLGRMGRLTVTTPSSEVRYACFLSAFLLVLSAIFYDVLSATAFAPLIYGSIMNMGSET